MFLVIARPCTTTKKMRVLDSNLIIFCSFVLQILFQRLEFFSNRFFVFYMMFFWSYFCFIRFSEFSIGVFFLDMTNCHTKFYI
jgi:hypothetical protein